MSALKPQALKNAFKKRLTSRYSPNEITVLFELLVERLDDLTRSDIILNHTELEFNNYETVLQKLEEGVPVQYVLGETTFYNLSFRVDNRVLIPRPETEELVEWIVQENIHNKLRILDIGTGSGCIAISLAKALPASTIAALDVSEDALTLARQNAIINEVEVDFQRVDILTEEINELYNVIVSNPPYISLDEAKLMEETVLHHEPHLALFSQDPLAFYKRIIDLFIDKKTAIYFEINPAFKTELEHHLKTKKLRFDFKSDVNSNIRFLKVWLAP